MPEHLRKAKVKIKNTQPSNGSIDYIDLMAKKYLADKEASEAMMAEVEQEKRDIKDRAERQGHLSDDGKKKIVAGKDYEIGYILADQQPTIDQRAAETLLSTKQLRQITSHYIDPKALETLVQKGEISSER